MDVPTVFAILVPPIVVVIGVVVGARMTRTTQRQTLDAELNERRLAAFGHSLGSVKTLLSDSDPNRVSMNANERSMDLIAELRLRWGEIRGPLEGIAITDENEGVREALSRLIARTGGVLHFDAWMIRDLLEGNPWTEMHRTAVEQHKEATEALKTTGELVRGRQSA